MKTLESLKTLWRHSLERVVSWLRPKRFGAWAKRDAELMEKWFAAERACNYGECARLREEIRENWRTYRDAS